MFYVKRSIPVHLTGHNRPSGCGRPCQPGRASVGLNSITRFTAEASGRGSLRSPFWIQSLDQTLGFKTQLTGAKPKQADE
jgi:hypothetical protein